MAVQFMNVESFFFLRKFIRPKNPLLSARIAYFVFLRRSTKKRGAKFKGRAKKGNNTCPPLPFSVDILCSEEERLLYFSCFPRGLAFSHICGKEHNKAL